MLLEAMGFTCWQQFSNRSLVYSIESLIVIESILFEEIKRWKPISVVQLCFNLFLLQGESLPTSYKCAYNHYKWPYKWVCLGWNHPTVIGLSYNPHFLNGFLVPPCSASCWSCLYFPQGDVVSSRWCTLDLDTCGMNLTINKRFNSGTKHGGFPIYIIYGCFRGFPLHKRRIHTAYIGEYSHFRYLNFWWY